MLVNLVLKPGNVDFRKVFVVCILLFFSPKAYPDNILQADQKSLVVQNVVLGIISYSRWPQTLEKVNICVVGSTHYADDLLTSQQPNIDVVRRYPAEFARLATTCNVVYIGQLRSPEKQLLYRSIAGKPVLTIHEENKLCDDGALVCLMVTDERVGFQINVDAVARSGLRIQPKVLMLGR